MNDCRVSVSTRTTDETIHGAKNTSGNKMNGVKYMKRQGEDGLARECYLDAHGLSLSGTQNATNQLAGSKIL
jgi:hypothetical protein